MFYFRHSGSFWSFFLSFVSSVSVNSLEIVSPPFVGCWGCVIDLSMPVWWFLLERTVLLQSHAVCGTLQQYGMKACACQTCAVYVGYIFIWHNLIKVLDLFVSSMCLALKYHKTSLFFWVFHFVQRLGFFRQMSTLAEAVRETKRRVTCFLKYCLVKFSLSSCLYSSNKWIK